MKKKSQSKKIPIGIKAVSVLFICNAVLLLATLLLGYPIYYTSPLALWISQILSTVLGGGTSTLSTFGTIPSVLGISYVVFVAMIMRFMLQSNLIFNLVLLTFAALYLGSGIGLMKRKSWAKKLSIILLVMSIFGNPSSVLLNYLLSGFSLSLFWSICIGVLLSGAVLYYLTLSKEGRAFFA